MANSLAGSQAGCRQVECAVNGIGERAGNASLEEIVIVAAHARAGAWAMDRIETTEIARTSRWSRADAVTEGQDALGEVSVVVEVRRQTGAGQGVSTDIIARSRHLSRR